MLLKKNFCSHDFLSNIGASLAVFIDDLFKHFQLKKAYEKIFIHIVFGHHHDAKIWALYVDCI